METAPMHPFLATIALTLALTLPATAGGITAATAPAARPEYRFDAFGCLVKPIYGRDGTVLYTNAVNPGQVECLIPEDGPLAEDEEAAAPAPTPTPTLEPEPEPTPGDDGPVEQL
jgi:hypothetical protein